MTPTREEIAAAMTFRGGWTKAQLAEWGVPWPPPKGWRAELEGRHSPGSKPLVETVKQGSIAKRREPDQRQNMA